MQVPDEVNAPFRLASGTVYPDLRWPQLRLIVEVDSAEWHDDPLAQARGGGAGGVTTSSWRAPCSSSAP
jgi:hypothetical protein